jgi:hypothetical protein
MRAYLLADRAPWSGHRALWAQSPRSCRAKRNAVWHNRYWAARRLFAERSPKAPYASDSEHLDRHKHCDADGARIELPHPRLSADPISASLRECSGRQSHGMAGSNLPRRDFGWNRPHLEIAARSAPAARTTTGRARFARRRSRPPWPPRTAACRAARSARRGPVPARDRA